MTSCGLCYGTGDVYFAIFILYLNDAACKMIDNSEFV